MADQAPAQTDMSKNIRSDAPDREHPPPGFEFAEHFHLGDMIWLNSEVINQSAVIAGTKPLVLPSQVKLTYGEINALAGDFYAARKPISDGQDDKECHDLFMEAWGKLGASTSKIQPKDANTLRVLHQEEIDYFLRAVIKVKNPSEVYTKLPDIGWKLQWATITNRIRFFTDTYLHISLNNLDHFGEDAQACYRIGHKAAIDFARNGGDLNTAFGMNAFADHFLEDLFSPGHMRTPRRDLHGMFVKDTISKFMHDEECAIGLKVSNNNKQDWMAYGDKRLMDEENKQNCQYCLEAVQASATEVYHAWLNQEVPGKYKALDIIPTRASIDGAQTLAPLFRKKSGKLQRRKNLAKRDEWNYIDFSESEVSAIALQCSTSGLFKHPIKMNS